jgi:catalase
MPVFFIQDAIKFPDVIHAVKPEPHNEVPQGQSAHNNFWDFVGLQPECMTYDLSIPVLCVLMIVFLAAHMVMWVMSDRGIYYYSPCVC